MSSFRESSKQNWTSNTTTEHINAGSLQRIADAVEKMASNYTKLQSDKDYYENLAKDRLKRMNELERRISSLKGVITKLKKKVK